MCKRYYSYLKYPNDVFHPSGPPPPPNDVEISFTQTTLSINWTQPYLVPQCIEIASYTVITNITNTAINTNNKSIDIPLDGLSPGIYCVSVAAVDTANTTGSYSDQIKFELAGFFICCMLLVMGPDFRS